MKTATLVKYLLNYIYPLRCASCKKPLNALDVLGVCGTCIGTVKKNPKPYCASCGRALATGKALCPDCQKRRFHFARAYSACLHEGVAKELIHAFKYRNRIGLSKTLSLLMTDFIRENREILDRVDAVTFVPLRIDRLRKRRYNQSRVLAEALSKEFGIPLIDSLEKVKATRPQNELVRSERLDNVKGSLRARPRTPLNGLTMLLVDDVMATGATLDESSRLLRESGAAEVRCLTLSRGL